MRVITTQMHLPADRCGKPVSGITIFLRGSH